MSSHQAEKGYTGPGWFWTQAEWAEWSNDLARLLPEEYGDDVAQEAIIERALGDLVRRATEAETALHALTAWLDEVTAAGPPGPAGGFPAFRDRVRELITPPESKADDL